MRINHPKEEDEETDFNHNDDLANLGYSVPYIHEVVENEEGVQGEAAIVTEIQKRQAAEEETAGRRTNPGPRQCTGGSKALSSRKYYQK